MEQPGEAYRPQDGVHKLVEVTCGHEVAALEDAHGQLGDNRQVGLKGLADDVAEHVVVVERLDLLDLAEHVKGVVVQLVDGADVRVGHDGVGQLLDVSNAMREPGVSVGKHARETTRQKDKSSTYRVGNSVRT